MDKFKTLEDFQQNAKKKLKPQIYGYYSSGANDEITLRENIDAFHDIYIIPRVLSGFGSVDLSTQLLGHSLKKPFGFAPSAMQRLAHPLGQQISATVALKQGMCLTLSTLSTVSLLQIYESNLNGVRFMQLYINKDREITKTLIELAQNYGFKGLVVTVDAQVLGKRINDIRNDFSSPAGTKFQILEEIHARMKSRTNDNLNRRDFVVNRDLSLDWRFVEWVRGVTKLPIILKGICSVEDAELAAQYKVDAIWISNHGGRQLDTVRPTIEILADITKSKTYASKIAGLTRGKTHLRPQVYVDGGVRKGVDIFKCLALGADYVFLGRPLIYSLVEGEQGVKRMVDLLSQQLSETMMIAGTPTIAHIDRSVLLNPQPKL